MTNEQNFYKALDIACVRYVSNEVVRILNLRDDDKCYVPSSGLVLHILRWLAIYLTTRLGEMQWRFIVKDMVRKNLASRYANMHGVTDDHLN